MQKWFRAQGKVCVECMRRAKEKDWHVRMWEHWVWEHWGSPQGEWKVPSNSQSLYNSYTMLWCNMCSRSEERQGTQEAFRPEWPADEIWLVPQGETTGKDREDIVWAQRSTLSREQQCFNWTVMRSCSRTADGQYEERQQRGFFLHNTWLRRCLCPEHRVLTHLKLRGEELVSERGAVLLHLSSLLSSQAQSPSLALHFWFHFECIEKLYWWMILAAYYLKEWKSLK